MTQQSNPTVKPLAKGANDLPNVPHDFGSLFGGQQDQQTQLAQLQALIVQMIHAHLHNGNDAQQINLTTDITGLFEVVSAVPTGTPRRLYDQIKIYTNSTTYRLYWYDYTAHVWHYATGT